MWVSLDHLKNALGLRSGEMLARESPQSGDISPAAILPWLASRRVHEFADVSALAGDWQPPLTLLAGLTAELPFEGSIAWIGRRCWPTFQFFPREGPDARHVLARHIFLDPLSDAERVWGICEVARSSSVRVIVADGSGFSSTDGRKLQLAAEKGNAVVLLARPASEFSKPSWATTRWSVSPLPSQTGRPRWKVALNRVTGTRQGQDASRHWIVSWTYEVFRGSGTLDLSPDVGRGVGATTTQATAALREIA